MAMPNSGAEDTSVDPDDLDRADPVRGDLQDQEVAADAVERLRPGAAAAGDIGRDAGVGEVVIGMDVAVQGEVDLAGGQAGEQLGGLAAAAERAGAHADRID